MFGFLKNKKKQVSKYLSEWQIPVDSSFELIVNDDSWQYTNEDGSRMLYFSILKVTGDPSILGNSLQNAEPKVEHTEDAWHLKSTKTAGNIILVCVISFASANDRPWAEELFRNITFNGS